MRNRGKRLAALLGAVALVICQNGAMEVRAEEVPTTEESQPQEEAQEIEVDSQNPEDLPTATSLAETEAVGTEEVPATDESHLLEETQEMEVDSLNAENEPMETAERTAQVLPVINLRWENGEAVFYNPNTSKVQFEIHIFKDGSYAGGKTTTNTNGEADAAGEVRVNLNYCFSEYGEGSYTYQVVTFADGVKRDHLLNGAGTPSEVSSAYSDQDNPSQDDRKLLPATNLEWNERWQGSFYNPNEHASLVAYVYGPDGQEAGQFYDGQVHPEGNVTYDLYHILEKCGENGTYTFAVEAVYWNGDVRVMSDRSSESAPYTKPAEQLPRPELTVTESGIISCELSGVDQYVLGDDYGFDYEVYEGSRRVFQWGNNVPEIDLGREGVVREGHSYLIKVRTLSRKINNLLSSEWVEYTLDLRTEKGDQSGEDSSRSGSDSDEGESSDNSSVMAVEEWKPVTSDEIKRYAAYSKEKVNYTADVANAYGVTIQNAMQGKQCFDSFGAVLNDWVIGRTYNILPAGKFAYTMDTKVRIVLTIPKALQKEGREFKMICVTEKGRPVILNDLDTNPETITFETDTFYAFALIYKDTVAK